MLRSVLHAPYAMILRRLNVRSYKLEAVVIALVGALGIPGWAWIAFHQLNAIQNSPFDDSELGFALTGRIIEPLLFAVIVWVWYTIASHLLSLHFKGRGPIGRLFRVAAWTLVPIAIWNLLKSIALLVSFWTFEWEPQVEGLQPMDRIQTILEAGVVEPVWSVTLLLGVFFVVWSGYLLSLAVAEVKGLSPRESRIVAAVPSGVYALWLLYDTLLWIDVL